MKIYYTPYDCIECRLVEMIIGKIDEKIGERVRSREL